MIQQDYNITKSIDEENNMKSNDEVGPIHPPSNYNFSAKFLNIYDLEDVNIKNISLLKYINKTRATLNSGRNHRSHIRRLGINIIERFLCCLMRTCNNTGKKTKMYTPQLINPVENVFYAI